MKTSILALGISLALATSPTFSKDVYIGIDQSGSNPAAVDETAAKIAGNFLRGKVAALQYGDFVHISTLGDRSSQHTSRTLRIDRKNPPAEIGARVGQYIQSMPSQTLKGTKESNILAYLEFKNFGCERGATVILVSDAVESSATMKARDLLSGRQPLPAPEADILKGCEVIVFNFGRSVDGSITPKQTKTLKAAWAAWFKVAGAKFTPIIDG